jgi:hypothetical protein
MNGSPKLQLNRNDMLSVLRGALLAAGGALVTYLATEVVPNLDEGTTLGALIAGIAATALNLLRKYASDTR